MPRPARARRDEGKYRQYLTPVRNGSTSSMRMSPFCAGTNRPLCCGRLAPLRCPAVVLFPGGALMPPRAVQGCVGTADSLIGVTKTSDHPQPKASSAATDAARADGSVVLAETLCPRCGTSSTAPERDRSGAAAVQHCISCGYAWRWLAPGSNAFSLILAHKVHASAPVEDDHAPSSGVFRAARFLVRMPLRYCPVGSPLGAWA